MSAHVFLQCPKMLISSLPPPSIGSGWCDPSASCHCSPPLLHDSITVTPTELRQRWMPGWTDREIEAQVLMIDWILVRMLVTCQKLAWCIQFQWDSHNLTSRSIYWPEDVPTMGSGFDYLQEFFLKKRGSPDQERKSWKCCWIWTCEFGMTDETSNILCVWICILHYITLSDSKICLWPYIDRIKQQCKYSFLSRPITLKRTCLPFGEHGGLIFLCTLAHKTW